MLLFIANDHAGGWGRNKFQNISCYCLSEETSVGKITTHTFQNISCYCLSLKFNYEAQWLDVFQNISCYCLSGLYGRFLLESEISKHLMLLFIGKDITVIARNYSYFKTSHVIVYLCVPSHNCRRSEVFQNISCYCLSYPNSTDWCIELNFKTSHVIVYQYPYQFVTYSCYISKHLMLLFIVTTSWDWNCVKGFQNISCYCLVLCQDLVQVKMRFSPF